MSELTFNEFSRTNWQRHLDWPRSKPATKAEIEGEWNLSEWGNAVAEEAGELCGAIKRINRIAVGHVINGKTNEPLTREDAILMLKKEIGDVVTYLDLMAQSPELNTTLEECVRAAFNGVSDRQGLPHKV